MASSSRGAASAGPRPLFGVEIEIYVHLLPAVENMMYQRAMHAPHTLPPYWSTWDWTLENGQGELSRKEAQRTRVGHAIKGIIDATLGPGNGWSCESDASLKEWQLTHPPDPRKWWGIEIISPPMSVSKQWQEEIETVFQAVGQTFDFWTNECCACHVHVSPGPTKSTKYTMPQLVRMAKGAFFWENALCDLLPPERRDNRYANPNYTGYATDLYDTVPRFGWGPVFSSLSSLGQAGQSAFVMALKGGPGPNETRYMSTNFDPLARLGTVELRRQAGVASAQTTIHRVLLAVTFHVSALRYNFAGAAQRTEYTHGDELIRELAGCIKQLPDTCKGSRFVAWLKWCDESYANSRSFTERQINSRERALRNGAPAVPEAAPPPPRNLPSARRAITPPPQRPPGLSVRVNLPSARGPPLQQPPRQQQQPVRLPVRSGPPPAAPSPPPPLPSARHRDESPVRRPLARRNTARAPSRAPSPRRSGPSRASAARDESPPRTRNRRPLIQRDESPPRPPLQQRRPRRQDSQSSSGRPVVQVVYDNYVDPSRYQHQERYGY